MLNSSASANFSPVKVDIFNSQYTVKPTENLSEDDIRRLAGVVDQMMHQVSQKGGHDTLSIAIMVALNIAAQMHEDQKRTERSLRRLNDKLERALKAERPSDQGHNTSALQGITA